jgi:hypothetical protein
MMRMAATLVCVELKSCSGMVGEEEESIGALFFVLLPRIEPT